MPTKEQIDSWFQSFAELAKSYDIDVNEPTDIARLTTFAQNPNKKDLEDDEPGYTRIPACVSLEEYNRHLKNEPEEFDVMGNPTAQWIISHCTAPISDETKERLYGMAKAGILFLTKADNSYLQQVRIKDNGSCGIICGDEMPDLRTITMQKAPKPVKKPKGNLTEEPQVHEAPRKPKYFGWKNFWNKVTFGAAFKGEMNTYRQQVQTHQNEVTAHQEWENKKGEILDYVEYQKKAAEFAKTNESYAKALNGVKKLEVEYSNHVELQETLMSIEEDMGSRSTNVAMNVEVDRNELKKGLVDLTYDEVDFLDDLKSSQAGEESKKMDVALGIAHRNMIKQKLLEELGPEALQPTKDDAQFQQHVIDQQNFWESELTNPEKRNAHIVNCYPELKGIEPETISPIEMTVLFRGLMARNELYRGIKGCPMDEKITVQPKTIAALVTAQLMIEGIKGNNDLRQLLTSKDGQKMIVSELNKGKEVEMSGAEIYHLVETSAGAKKMQEKGLSVMQTVQKNIMADRAKAMVVEQEIVRATSVADRDQLNGPV